MILKIRLIVFILILVKAFGAFADPTYSFGQPQVAGSGCPVGSISVALTQDGSILSVLFDQFSVESIKGVSPVVAQIKKSCNFKIPVSLPEGYSLETTQIYYSGFANLNKFGTATITTSGPLFGGKYDTLQPPPVKTSFTGGTHNFQISQTAGQQYQKNCRKIENFDFTTTIDISVNARTAGNLFGNMLVIDSADIVGQAPIQFALRLRACQ